MTLTFLSKIPTGQALALIQNSVEALRKDFRLNVEAGIFTADWGRELTFEEYIVMHMVEKDLFILFMRERLTG